MVLLEAMSYSLPIVATDIAGSGVPWVAGGANVCKLVAPADSTALARALGELLDNPSAARAMGAASNARFLNRFTLDAMVRNMIRLLTGYEQDR